MAPGTPLMIRLLSPALLMAALQDVTLALLLVSILSVSLLHASIAKSKLINYVLPRQLHGLQRRFVHDGIDTRSNRACPFATRHIPWHCSLTD